MIKAAWFQPIRNTFFAELADDTIFAGTQVSPRSIAVANLESNLKAVKEVLKANAVIIRLCEDDSFVAQYGSGFPYDPVARPRPKMAEAQEIVVSTAAQNGLGVIFAIDFSAFHRYMQDSWGTMGHGLYDFIHSLIDPARYYAEAPYSFINDSRVIGWILGGEWKPELQKEQYFINKYWNFFYDLVHWRGASNAWAGLYTNVALPSAALKETEARILAFKELFKPGGPNRQPDRYGATWYDGAGYPINQVWNDLHALADLFRTNNGNQAYVVPGAQVLLMEGGCTQEVQFREGYYRDAIGAAANTVSGICVWQTDNYANGLGANGPYSSDNEGELKIFSLFTGKLTKTGQVRTFTKKYPCLWHGVAGPDWTPIDQTFPTSVDSYHFESLTTIGEAVRDGFNAH
jgi:hypothetical protein